MRRILLSLAAVGSAALLSACAQGGTAFSANTTKATAVQVTANGDGQSSGTAKVLPGSVIVLSAQGINSPQNVVTGDSNFTWTVIPQIGGTYTNGPSGQRTPCPATYGSPATAFPAPQGALAAGVYTNGGTIPSSNNLALVAPPAPTAFGSAAVPASAPYCLVATATYVPTGAQGSITILVSSVP